MAEYRIRVADEIPSEAARSLIARLEEPLSAEGQFLFLRVPPGVDVAEASLRFQHVLAQMRAQGPSDA